MKVLFAICAVLILTIYEIYVGRAEAFAAPQFDISMSNLGSFINNQVQSHVKSITSKVNEEVSSINQNIHREMNDFSKNLRRRMDSISVNLDSQIKDLNARIHTNVENSMKPVHAMMIMSAMSNGVGGITVAVYGDRTTLLIINGNKYSCPGQIALVPPYNVPQCSQQLVPDTEENICTESSYSRLNNIYCFGNHALLQCMDNSCQCKNGNLYTLNAMRNSCGGAYGTDEYVQYTYYPDTPDPNHIKVPNANEHVRCIDANSGHCTWYGNGFIIPLKDI